MKAFEHAWSQDDYSLEQLTEEHLLGIDEEKEPETSSRTLATRSTSRTPTSMPSVMALSRKKLSLETAPTGKKLEEVKKLLLRVHRAAGHPGMSSLVKLLQARGAPGWALEIAQGLKCPECVEASTPKPHPPASLGEEPKIYEYLGTDVFEFEEPNATKEDEKKKHKLIIFRDRASGLTMIEHLAAYSGAWEPKTDNIIAAMTQWLSTYPSPKWLVADSARYYTSEQMMDFVNRSGVGLTIAPAEAHWLMGPEEGAINLAKKTVERLMKEHNELPVPILFKLAAAAANQHVGSTGFSAFQWVFGSGGGVLDDEQLMPGISPHKAFSGLAKARERAKLAFEKERANDRFSRLANSVGRPVSHKYTAGQLVMLWRQRVRPGKVKGHWVGPLRLIVQEQSTLWLASGATLIRAKINQVRPTTPPEQMKAQLEGTAIYKTPISVSSLLRTFQGRYYMDVSGDVPSERQQQLDLSPTVVLQPPPSTGLGTDSWSVVEQDGKRVLVRHHILPRLALFSPFKVTTCPVSLDDLRGTRVTHARMVNSGETVVIKDSVEETKSLQERWTGESHFELKEVIGRATKVRKRVESSSSKRKAEAELQRPKEDSQEEKKDDEAEASLEPDPQQARGEEHGDQQPLTQALRQGGPDQVDGLPAREPGPSGSAGSNLCNVPECVLPGGHLGHHEDSGGNKFLYDNYDGRKAVVSDGTSSESSSTSSTSDAESEELIRDGELPNAEPEVEEPKETFICIELDIEDKDIEYLNKHRNAAKAGKIWLSKKMSEKAKELEWKHLNLNEKKDFDMAEAKEISNVIVSKALRALTPAEMKKQDYSKIMQMRWVLTRKGNGTAKARLVVLGFQAHNLTEVATSSPTMSKGGRNTLLGVSAAKKFLIKSGDVTSAFLQTDTSLEDEDLVVWGPPELSAAYGANPGDMVPLKVMQAFYGLAHAPRKWYERCVRTLKEHGWRQLQGDRCLFALYDSSEELVALAGIHVDDFLIGGNTRSTTFNEAEKKLQDAFRWGKWETKNFEFAGCNITQKDNYEIILDQEQYVNRWVEEAQIDPSRPKSADLLPSEVAALRGVLGTASWRATQTAPQFLAETSLLLSEIGKATIDTLYRANKLVREMRRDAAQGLLFPTWEPTDLCVVTWVDASQHNRADKSSTVGVISALAPADVLEGTERQFAILQWKSGKCPRQALGSNGAEVQAVTIGEDQNFQLRSLVSEILGSLPQRGRLPEHVKKVKGAIVMDSRGIYDASTRNLSALHGLRDSRSGYELTLAVNQAKRADAAFRWVNGLAQLADALTKHGAMKVLLQFYQQKQYWRLVHDEKFTSGRKIHKREMLKKLKEHHDHFIYLVKKLAKDNNYPWDETEDYGDFEALT